MKEQPKTPPWQIGGLSPGDIAWLSKQFEQIDRALISILRRLDELEVESGPSAFVIPDLETEIQRAALLSKKIDDKVPDR